ARDRRRAGPGAARAQGGRRPARRQRRREADRRVDLEPARDRGADRGDPPARLVDRSDGSEDGSEDRKHDNGRLMGILDRIAGTLDELTGDTDAGVASEVMRAQALAEAGDLDGAGAALRAVTERFPRYAPGYVALGQLAAQRGRLEEAVTALGRAVDL